MPWKFNPFSGTLDQTGSGGGGASYIDGEVQYFSDLPQTVGSPAVDSAYLVREAEGAWLLARKPAGIYIRTANSGVRADDWTHASAFPDVFNDANFLLYDNGDATKNLQFQLSGITTGTTRTLTVPNSSGEISLSGHTHIASDIIFGQFANNRINWASPDPIGSSVPQSGTFTTLSANNGTLTASAPVLDLSQTWNASGVTFTGLRFNATDTASAAASLLADFQTGGTSRVRFTKAGSIVASGSVTASSITTSNQSTIGTATVGGGSFAVQADSYTASFFQYRVASSAGIYWDNGTKISSSSGNTVELIGNTATSPQTLRIFGTFTGSTNYQRMAVRSVKQTLSALSGASATTTGTLIPDGAVVVGVTTRVATAITGATGYQVGDGTDADRWGDINAIALNTTSDNRDWTAGTIECFTAGGNITLTANTNNFTAGAVEICVFYLAGEAD